MCGAGVGAAKEHDQGNTSCTKIAGWGGGGRGVHSRKCQCEGHAFRAKSQPKNGNNNIQCAGVAWAATSSASASCCDVAAAARAASSALSTRHHPAVLCPTYTGANAILTVSDPALVAEAPHLLPQTPPPSPASPPHPLNSRPSAAALNRQQQREASRRQSYLAPALRPLCPMRRRGARWPR